jgi:hypothetical protein
MHPFKTSLTLIVLSLVMALFCAGCAPAPYAPYKEYNEQKQREFKAQQQSQSYGQPQQVQQAPTAYEEAVIRQMQYQNLQNSIQQLTAPKIITPLPSYTNQNQAPFYQAPQQPLTNPSVNCVPNGGGGFRCQ